jgi:AraC-like DNA-binding protein
MLDRSTTPFMTPSDMQQVRIVGLLDALAPQEGYNLSRLDRVRFLRSDRPLARTPVLYEPGIVIVCQGRKRGFFGGDIYVYDAHHYLAVSVPVPFTMETDASADAPLLAIYMSLDQAAAAAVLLQIDQADGTPPAPARSMMATRMDDSMSGSVLRFLEAMSDPLAARVLGPSLVQELYFRVLTGAQGASMRAALAMQGQFGKIARALRRIHAGYAGRLAVDVLAREAAMSVPSFHAHFRAVTGTSPVQYLKSVRLHQARLLMLRQEVGAAAAGAAVGYESSSQFSREFHRLFGRPPAEEVRRLRTAYALPAWPADTAFVSSH